MKAQLSSNQIWDKARLRSDQIMDFFMQHLDRIYAAKTVLLSQLPRLLDVVYADDLKEAVVDALTHVKMQIAGMDQIYVLLGWSNEKTRSPALKGFIDEAFEAIMLKREHEALRDMSIIFYLQNMESVEMASFQVLQMAAVKIQDKRIGQILENNYYMAKSDRTLLLMLSSKYLC